MAGFPITQGQLEEHLRDKGFLTNLTIESFLVQAEYLTEHKMREWVQTRLRTELDEMRESTRQQIVQVVSDENAKFTELREVMQKLLDSTESMSANFSDQVAAASSDLDQTHAATLAALQARDAHLRAYVDATQQGNQETFELLSTQLASIGDGK